MKNVRLQALGCYASSLCHATTLLCCKGGGELLSYVVENGRTKRILLLVRLVTKYVYMKTKAMALALLVTSYFFITPQVDAQSRTDNAIGIGSTAMVGGIAAALIAGELQEQHRNRLEQMAVTDYLKSKHKGENFKL